MISGACRLGSYPPRGLAPPLHHPAAGGGCSPSNSPRTSPQGRHHSLTPSPTSCWSPTRRPVSTPVTRPVSAPAAPELETEEEYVQYYQQRILSAQERQLYPLKEDLADWLNKTLGVLYLTAENFMEALDNGLVVCRLAQVIQERAQEAVDAGRAKGPVPTIRARLWENAARRSFFSRDNMENFIRFCRALGVHENLIFESDDLVMHAQPRSVVLCLLEVSRLASSRYGLEPPGLVQLEHEIAAAAQRSSPHAALSDSGLSNTSLMSWQPPSSPPTQTKMRHSSSSSAVSMGSPGSSGRWSRPHSAERSSPGLFGDNDQAGGAMRRALSDGVTAGASDGVASDAGTDEDEELDWGSRGSSLGDRLGHHEGNGTDTPSQVEDLVDKPVGKSDLNELDRKVQQAARAAQRQCRCEAARCDKLRVRKVGAGKYNIAGRNVFVRLLKGRHMMVRVGGGWDTLEHFLERHDPCQVRVLPRSGGDRATPSPRRMTSPRAIVAPSNSPASRRQSAAAVLTPSPSPGPGSNSGYLHIRAKYRSPPPARS